MRMKICNPRNSKTRLLAGIVILQELSLKQENKSYQQMSPDQYNLINLIYHHSHGSLQGDVQSMQLNNTVTGIVILQILLLRQQRQK